MHSMSLWPRKKTLVRKKETGATNLACRSEKGPHREARWVLAHTIRTTAEQRRGGGGKGPDSRGAGELVEGRNELIPQ